MAVTCVGLSCLDMLLLESATPATPEHICTFSGVKNVPGGSVCNTARALCRISVPTAVLTVVGEDAFGHELLDQMSSFGANTQLVVRSRSVSTSLSILPVFRNGGRGCFVDLGANLAMDKSLILGTDPEKVLVALRSSHIVHFGYPHLLPKLQGVELEEFILEIRDTNTPANGPIFTMDINGVSSSDPNVLCAPLKHTGLLHANLEEAHLLARKAHLTESANLSRGDIEQMGDFFLEQGLAIVAITLGAEGCFLKINSDHAVLHRNLGRFANPFLDNAGEFVFQKAFEAEGSINATGAGDSFTAGMLAALHDTEWISSNVSPSRTGLDLLARAGAASSLWQIDTAKSHANGGNFQNTHEFLNRAASSPTLIELPSSFTP